MTSSQQQNQSGGNQTGGGQKTEPDAQGPLEQLGETFGGGIVFFVELTNSGTI